MASFSLLKDCLISTPSGAAPDRWQMVRSRVLLDRAVRMPGQTGRRYSLLPDKTTAAEDG